MSEFKFLDKWGLPYPPRHPPERLPRLFHKGLRIEEEIEIDRILKEYPRLNIKLTSPFLINESRKEILSSLFRKEKISENKVIEFLKSNDFIERIAGLYFLRKKIPTISEKNHREFFIILKTMEEKEEDWFIRMALARALPKLSEKGLPILEKMENDPNPHVQRAAIHSKIQIIIESQKEKAFPILAKIKNHKNWIFRQVLAQNLCKLGEKGFSFLKELENDKNRNVREAAIYSKIQIIIDTQRENLSLSSLKEIKDHKDWRIRKIFVRNLPKLKLSENFFFLVEKSNDEDWRVRQEVVRCIVKLLGEKAVPFLEKMKEDKDRRVQETVKRYLMGIREGYKWVLGTSKPWLATPYREEVVQRLFKLQETAKKLEEKFGDKFLGIIIYGSTAKGYASEESDLECILLTEDENCAFEFKKMMSGFNFRICSDWDLFLRDQTQKKKCVFFQGLFLGKQKKLLKIQWELLKNMNEQEWDKEVRNEIMKHERFLSPTQEKLGLTPKEKEKIELATILLRTPPCYEEALNIIKEKLRKQIQREKLMKMKKEEIIK